MPGAIKQFCTYLKSGKRVVKVPHVMIVHRSSLSGNLTDEESKGLWGHCEGLYGMPYCPFFRGKLGNVTLGVMALMFEDLGLDIVRNDGNAGGSADVRVDVPA